ncbi:MAG: hypothetical protein ABIH23_21890 [bacterium]
MSLAGQLSKNCPICGGELPPRGRDICCYEEDRYLLSELRSFMRANPKRGVAIGGMVEYLYERLEPYLAGKGIDLHSIDPDVVFGELERRTLRWIARKDISISSISGLALCESCGAMIMRGRTVCNNCVCSKEVASLQKAWTPSEGRYIPRGMHVRINR